MSKKEGKTNNSNNNNSKIYNVVTIYRKQIIAKDLEISITV